MLKECPSGGSVTDTRGRAPSLLGARFGSGSKHVHLILLKPTPSIIIFKVEIFIFKIYFQISNMLEIMITIIFIQEEITFIFRK